MIPLEIEPATFRLLEQCLNQLRRCVPLFQFPGSFRFLNLLKPNDAYIGRTAPLTSRCCILYIYPTYKRTEYFKHAAYSPFFSLQNAVYFIILPCLVPVLFAFYIQGVLKFKCKIPVPKGLLSSIFLRLLPRLSVTLPEV